MLFILGLVGIMLGGLAVGCFYETRRYVQVVDAPRGEETVPDFKLKVGE
jgi:hypothetical protein